MKPKFKATPVFRINWFALALVGVAVVVALIASLLGII